jgi:aconitate hydratase
MGVLPLEFLPEENVKSLGLTGTEVFHIEGVVEAVAGGRRARVRAVAADGAERAFEVSVRVDTPQEAEYYRSGGILPYVLRQLAG